MFKKLPMLQDGWDDTFPSGYSIRLVKDDKPIGYVGEQDDGDYNGSIIYEHKHKEHFVPVFTAPIRTKDLTDEEAEFAFDRGGNELCLKLRAVIAADREKNK